MFVIYTPYYRHGSAGTQEAFIAGTGRILCFGETPEAAIVNMRKRKICTSERLETLPCTRALYEKLTAVKDCSFVRCKLRDDGVVDLAFKEIILPPGERCRFNI